METINGEFIMKGCAPEDPDALHSPFDAVSLIHRVGFLPLFSNSIPGFSIEEHVPGDHWWTGDPEIDPWEWRQILAGDESIAYGKFFNKTAVLRCVFKPLAIQLLNIQLHKHISLKHAVSHK